MTVKLEMVLHIYAIVQMLLFVYNSEELSRLKAPVKRVLRSSKLAISEEIRPTKCFPPTKTFLQYADQPDTIEKNNRNNETLAPRASSHETHRKPLTRTSLARLKEKKVHFTRMSHRLKNHKKSTTPTSIFTENEESQGDSFISPERGLGVGKDIISFCT